MKKKLLFLWMFAIASISMQAQVTVIDTNESVKSDSIDRVRFRVQYQMTYVSDTTKHPLKPREETLMLEVGTHVSKCYSYTVYRRDSVLRADVAAGASQETLNQHAQAFGSGQVTYKVFRNYPEGKVTFTDRLGGVNFLCEEANERPQWKLLPDTATILTYHCRKAACHFKGRTYTAWYTEEIPLPEGPWKLFGLPGLILKAEDSRGHYAFRCTGVEQCRTLMPLTIYSKGHERVSRSELNKLYERYAQDVIGFMVATSPNMKVTIRNQQGNVIKKMPIPYNPIEQNK